MWLPFLVAFARGGLVSSSLRSVGVSVLAALILTVCLVSPVAADDFPPGASVWFGDYFNECLVPDGCTFSPSFMCLYRSCFVFDLNVRRSNDGYCTWRREGTAFWYDSQIFIGTRAGSWDVGIWLDEGDRVYVYCAGIPQAGYLHVSMNGIGLSHYDDLGSPQFSVWEGSVLALFFIGVVLLIVLLFLRVV